MKPAQSEPQPELTVTELRALTRDECNELYDDVLLTENEPSIRWLCLNDLFFLLTRMCQRKDIDRQWLFERCREVEANPNNHLDLWAREHYKSTIITFGLTLKDILNNPELTVGIFSHTKSIARTFLAQLKQELEMNKLLQYIFRDILYANPKKESPCWALDRGLTIKRKTNPKEQTLEAYGLVDGQPTSKHFMIMIYDDTVTLESVSTTEQITKTTDAWAMSLNLSAGDGAHRYIGTRYHTNDTYREMMKRGAATPRLYPATHDGTEWGNPVFLTEEKLHEKRRLMGPYVFASQMLQNPTADRAQKFKLEWLKFWTPTSKSIQLLNIYIVVDPASKRKKDSDYTTLWVIGLGRDNNYYVVDCVRDRLTLTGRTDALFKLHRLYTPVGVGYEEYGLQADIEHIEYVMNIEMYHFKITPLGGRIAKEDRIKSLMPIFETGRIFLPPSLPYTDYENTLVDLIQVFKDDEYRDFPVSAHDDMLDALARITDPKLKAEFPNNLLRQRRRGKHAAFRTGGDLPWGSSPFRHTNPLVLDNVVGY